MDPQPVHRFDVAGEESQRQRFVEEDVVGERYECSAVRVDHPFLYRVLQRFAFPHFLERGVEAPPRACAELAARPLRLPDHLLELCEYDELFEAVGRHVPDAPPEERLPVELDEGFGRFDQPHPLPFAAGHDDDLRPLDLVQQLLEGGGHGFPGMPWYLRSARAQHVSCAGCNTFIGLGGATSLHSPRALVTVRERGPAPVALCWSIRGLVLCGVGARYLTWKCLGAYGV